MSQRNSGTLQTMAMELSEEERRVVNSLILLNPDLLTAQYKNSKGLASEAETYVAAGNLVVARNRFESAAKLALYEGDLESAKAYLKKSLELAKESSFSIALNDFHKISTFVVESYKNRAVRVS